MPKVNDLSAYFQSPENIPLESIVSHLGKTTNPELLQNEICNRIIYSRTIPVNSAEMAIDLAIFKEGVKMNSTEFYNQGLRSILIPEDFLDRLPALNDLVWAFIDVLRAPDISSIFLKQNDLGTRSLGSVILPKIIDKNGIVCLTVEGRKYEIKIGSAQTIPATESHVDIKFSSKSATLLHKNEVVTEVVGGAFGLAVDLRF